MPRSGSLARELNSIRAQFRRSAKSFTRIAPLLTAMTIPDGNSARKPSRSRLRLTVQQRAALKLQGKYMGTKRKLKPVQRKKVKKVRAEKGIRAAIAHARWLAS